MEKVNSTHVISYSKHMNKTKKGMLGLTLGALGIVFGDIGTSPLYSIQAVFGGHGQGLAINQDNVYGIISVILWSVTLVVSIKFLGFIMRADNQGEGGIIALVGLISGSKLASKFKWQFIALGLLGVALFYGDSIITPAISVLAAVEGLKLVAPSLDSLVIPITLVVLAFLFGIQRFGTTWIGRFFGPVMLMWFLTIGLGGLAQILQQPDILATLSPLVAVNFFVTQPMTAFISLGAVILVITGAEALYADMGHFGRAPISRAWFLLVFPALLLCYMGQGSLLLESPSAVSSPFFLLYPEMLRIPIVILATMATLIASQAVISGAFSLTHQAVKLNFLPKMRIQHTSDHETGQVYIPFINTLLFAAVFVVVIVFGSSEKLAYAYGLAVSSTLAIDTILFIVVARTLWKKSYAYVVALIVGFLIVDLLFVSATVTKIISGGWFPLAIAAVVLLVIQTWIKGQGVITKERREKEGSLLEFIDEISSVDPPIVRVPGTAVYISHHDGFVPMALHASIEKLHELHERVVIIYVNIANTAHVPEKKRAAFDDLGRKDGISCLRLTYGYSDHINIPRTLEALRDVSSELDFDPDEASYFVSMIKVALTKRHNLAPWRKSLYSLMSSNALSTSDYYKLPTERTVEIRSLIPL